MEFLGSQTGVDSVWGNIFNFFETTKVFNAFGYSPNASLEF